jgi:hypothetical protein
MVYRSDSQGHALLASGEAVIARYGFGHLGGSPVRDDNLLMRRDLDGAGIVAEGLAIDPRAEQRASADLQLAKLRTRQPNTPDAKRLVERERLLRRRLHVQHPGGVVRVQRRDEVLAGSDADTRGDCDRLALEKQVEVLVDVKDAAFCGE